ACAVAQCLGEVAPEPRRAQALVEKHDRGGTGAGPGNAAVFEAETGDAGGFHHRGRQFPRVLCTAQLIACQSRRQGVTGNTPLPRAVDSRRMFSPLTNLAGRLRRADGRVVSDLARALERLRRRRPRGQGGAAELGDPGRGLRVLSWNVLR
ncbi:MAG: hypothetical protein ACK56I_03470, partial [bacterium]